MLSCQHWGGRHRSRHQCDWQFESGHYALAKSACIHKAFNDDGANRSVVTTWKGQMLTLTLSTRQAIRRSSVHHRLFQLKPLPNRPQRVAFNRQTAPMRRYWVMLRPKVGGHVKFGLAFAVVFVSTDPQRSRFAKSRRAGFESVWGGTRHSTRQHRQHPIREDGKIPVEPDTQCLTFDLVSYAAAAAPS